MINGLMIVTLMMIQTMRKPKHNTVNVKSDARKTLCSWTLIVKIMVLWQKTTTNIEGGIFLTKQLSMFTKEVYINELFMIKCTYTIITYLTHFFQVEI